jgi:hypothetical protein
VSREQKFPCRYCIYHLYEDTLEFSLLKRHMPEGLTCPQSPPVVLSPDSKPK